MMRDAGLDYRHDPVSQSLQRVGVAAIMNRSFEPSVYYGARTSRRLASFVRKVLIIGPSPLRFGGSSGSFNGR